MINVERPANASAAVVFDSPHSGLRYPGDFRPAIDQSILRRAEDAYVDELFGDVTKHGALLLSARFPRSYIDPNRALEDLDPDMIDGDWPCPIKPSSKTAGGKGLIWKTVQLSGKIYDRRLSVAEVENRIANFWQPYHGALKALLDETFAAHGKVVHINYHSMRSHGHAGDPDGAVKRPDIVLGDLDGVSCSPEITSFVAENLRDLGYTVSVNYPYKGQELIRAYADPMISRHSLMIEVNRNL